MQPALPEPAIALALPLVEKQLELFGGQLPLATAILGFLSRLASTAKLSQTRDSGKGGVAEEEEEVYTLEQVCDKLMLSWFQRVSVNVCRLHGSWSCYQRTVYCAT